jgi:thioredoxin reductase (NADPH)
MEQMLQQAIIAGVQTISDTVTEVNLEKIPYRCWNAEGVQWETKNLLVATGTTSKKLEIPGEEEFFGFGVSTCAICDGNFFRQQTVIVVGGGETAGTEALYLATLASKVYLIYHRDNFWRMSATTQEKIKQNPIIEIIYSSVITEICGTLKPKMVKFVKISHLITAVITELTVNGVFVAIGTEPNTKIFNNSGLQLDTNGFIIVNENGHTNKKHLYAAGDVTNGHHKQAVVAAGQGAIAALEMIHEI